MRWCSAWPGPGWPANASAQTRPQIAQGLGLAASTVNNHLGLIFKRLAVSNKLQLVRLLGANGA